ncbi:hypothetical protein ACHQM5_026221 [Ranunculus cassubicifolius]
MPYNNNRHHFNNNNNNFHNRRGGGGGGPHHFHQQQRFHHPPPPPDHSFRGGRDDFSTGFMDDSGAGRKRPFPFPFRDAADNGGFAKLFIGSVPSRATEGDVRPLFEKYGNVVEVIFIKDKRTGRQQECCFVKYASVEEAERAIKALHNQYILPGENIPIQVRFATKEREQYRPFPTEPKLYVADLNKQATEKEIEEIFSPYGRVEDIHIMRDAMKQSRGTAFVQLQHRDMAEVAINALNGKYVMPGCVVPLAVRFADPKRPWAGRPRLESHHGDSLGGHQPNSWWGTSPENVGPSSKTREFSRHSIPKDGAVPVSTHMVNTSQQAGQQQISGTNSHSSWEVPSENSNRMSGDKSLKEESTSTAPPQQKEEALSAPCIQHKSPNQSAQDVSQEPQVQTSSDDAKQQHRPFCEWSEHICPDGDNYYYNCLTKESRWEKPNELAFFQKNQGHDRIPVSC